MIDPEDIARLQERLITQRTTLAHLLQQQAMQGSHTPPGIIHGIRAARDDIHHLKRALEDLGAPAEGHPDDEEPRTEDEIGTRLVMLENGTDLFTSGNPNYHYYYRSAALAAMIDTILTTPGYHVIESQMGTGKTALIGSLSADLQQQSRPVITYLFSRERSRTSIRNAVTSLYQQIDQLLGPAALLPERASTLSYWMVSSAAELLQHLTILIDGLDECNSSERVHLQDLLPDGRLRNITIVITTRPDFGEVVLRNLPAQHTLYGSPPEATRHHLPLFSLEDVVVLLSHFAIADPNGTIARWIHTESQGKPIWVYKLCKERASQPTDQWTMLRRLGPAWRRDLDQMRSLCPGGLLPLLNQLLPLLAVAKSGLTLSDLVDMLGCDHEVLLAIQAHLRRYLLSGPNQEIVFFDEHFREHLEEAMDAESLRRADQELRRWVEEWTKQTDLEHIPLYVLRHAAEYFAGRSDLWQFLARREWFEILHQRTSSRSACIDAIIRTRSAIEATMPPLTIDHQIVNLVACDIVRTSLSATLLPELVLKLVELKFWSDDAARDYARSYELSDNQRTVLEALENPLHQPNIPEGSAATDAAAELELYLHLPPALRAAKLSNWMRRWEPLNAHTYAQIDSERLELLLDALGQPVQIDGGPASIQRLSRLLEDLRQYRSPPTGQIGDPAFEKLLSEIAETWLRVSSEREQLVPILEYISRTSRADLLGSLEILAPALRALFPQAVNQLRAAVKTVVAAYLA